jgi:hypothetical protein
MHKTSLVSVLPTRTAWVLGQYQLIAAGLLFRRVQVLVGDAFDEFIGDYRATIERRPEGSVPSIALSYANNKNTDYRWRYLQFRWGPAFKMLKRIHVTDQLLSFCQAI